MGVIILLVGPSNTCKKKRKNVYSGQGKQKTLDHELNLIFPVRLVRSY